MESINQHDPITSTVLDLTPKVMPSGIYTDKGIEIEEIINKPPGFLLRSGIMMIAGLLVVLVCLAGWIQYPETIAAPAIITTEVPPLELFTRSGGKVLSLTAQNGRVAKGDIVMVLETTAHPADLAVLAAHMDRIESSLLTPGTSASGPAALPDTLSIGDLQAHYAALNEKIKEAAFYQSQKTVERQVSSIQNEIDQINQVNKSLQAEQKLFRQELALKEKDHERQQKLYSTGVISALEVEQNQTTLLQYQRQYENIRTNQVQNQIRIQTLQSEITRLIETRAMTLATYSHNILELIATLRQNLKNWQENFTVQAPAGGDLHLHDEIHPGTQLLSLQSIGYLLTDQDHDSLRVEIQVPLAGSGRIKAGDRILLDLTSFPLKEFGRLVTTVQSMTLMSRTNKESKSYYLVTAQLPPDLITDYGRSLPYQPNMAATATVYTDKRSLLARVFETFHHLLNKQAL